MMTKLTSIKILVTLVIKLVLILLYHSATAYAQDPINLDYFDPKFREPLAEVERYHFTPSTFWKHYRSGQWEYALAELRFILRYFPNHPTALMFLGSVAKFKKAPSLAMPFYQKALELYPQYALTHAQYGAYLVDIDFVSEGIAKLEDAIKIDPKLVPAYIWLAKAYDKIGRPELARQAEQQARELGYKAQIPGQRSTE